MAAIPRTTWLTLSRPALSMPALGRLAVSLPSLVIATLAITTDAAHTQSPDPISHAIKTFASADPDHRPASKKPSPRVTRFEILVPSRVEFKVQALRSPTNRVIVEIPTTRMVLPNPATSTRKNSLVKSFRGGISSPGQSRVVIQVTEPVVVQKQEIYKSPRGHAHHIALELVPAAAITLPPLANRHPFSIPPSGLGAAGLQPPMPAPAVRPSARLAKAYKPTIVIDPGHGGHDSGARKFGTVEKHVVLAFSKVLRRHLEATGHYKVLMTRKTDKFVTLDGRREYAEKNNAALFIAVHADYASRSSARGATIYTLRDRVADRLRTTAKRKARSLQLTKAELHSARRTGSEARMVRRILSDLAAREVDTTKKRTHLFSRTVVRNMGSATNMRGKPHRSAAFRVLKTAKVPSVLIELAYVTNRRDARLLKSETWREKVATSIREAVDKYFDKAPNPAALVSSRQ